jgi:hypothetical protein
MLFLGRRARAEIKKENTITMTRISTNTVHLRGHSRVLLAGIHFRKRLWMPD